MRKCAGGERTTGGLVAPLAAPNAGVDADAEAGVLVPDEYFLANFLSRLAMASSRATRTASMRSWRRFWLSCMA